MAKKKVHRNYRPGSGTGSAPNSARAGRATRVAAAPVVVPGWRGWLERHSKRAIVRMSLLPGWLVPVLLALMLFAGLVLPAAWAGGLLLAVGLFLAWLSALSWPANSAGARAVRVAVSLLVLTLGVLKLVGVI